MATDRLSYEDEIPDEANLRPEPESAAYWLLERIHDEQHCGVDGKHHSECELLVRAFGWESWDTWRFICEGLEL